MSSRKPSARAKRKEEFEAGLRRNCGIDKTFAQEQRRLKEGEHERKAALHSKSCASKKRYACENDAKTAIASCAEHGKRGLHCYRCPYCKGWHLTSRQDPWDDPRNNR